MPNDQEFPRWDGEKRPPMITIISILGIIFNLFGAIAPFYIPKDELQLLAQYNVHFTWIESLDSILCIIAYIGLLRMRWWGFILYTATALALFGYTVLIHNINYWTFGNQLIVVLIVVIYMHQLRRGL